MNGAVREVGPGCYVWLRLPGGWGETNIGLIAGDGAAVLVDTAWDPVLTRAMLDAFAAFTRAAPISLVINTHPDVDHWWGNSELPGAEILASAPAAQAMREELPPARMAAFRRVSALSGRIPGRPGRAGRYVAAMLAPFALDQVTPRFPDRTFSGRRAEVVGGRELEVIDFGAAHTASDSVVFVPDARVVYTGDLLFAGVTPVMWHGPLSGWLAALDAITALEADVFVAGHGAISTRAELRALHDYWSWLADAVPGHRDAGRDSRATAQALVRSREFAAFAGWENPERMFINVSVLARQLDGLGPIPATPIARARAFDGVACLAQQIGSGPPR
jgi:glyoxylase-like metal-dependent hydrolase (beta-lactamase superfamily II)